MGMIGAALADETLSKGARMFFQFREYGIVIKPWQWYHPDITNWRP